MKQAQRACDSCKGYGTFYTHYLGSNNVNNQASRAERKLRSTLYTCMKKRWSIEKYSWVHGKQHVLLDNLTAHGHTRIDKCSKVHHLIEGIKMMEPDSLKTWILSDTEPQADCSQCVSLYTDCMAQFASVKENATLNISQTAFGGSNAKSRTFILPQQIMQS